MNSNSGQGDSRQLHGVCVIASALVQQVVGGEEKQRHGQEAEHRAALVGEILGEMGVRGMWVRQVAQKQQEETHRKAEHVFSVTGACFLPLPGLLWPT